MVAAGSQSATMGKNGKCSFDGSVRAPYYSGDRKVGDTQMEDTKTAASEQQLIHSRTIQTIDENAVYDDAILVTQRTEVTIVNHNAGCLANATVHGWGAAGSDATSRHSHFHWTQGV